MTLSGRAAAERPDVDRPAAPLAPVIVHDIRPMDQRGTLAKYTRLGLGIEGEADTGTGSFTAGANRMTEAQRRAAGLRRNGRPKRAAAA